MVSYDNVLKFYPDTSESKEEVRKYKDEFLFYGFDRSMTNITGYKISDNMSSVEFAWIKDYSDKNATIFTYKENYFKGEPRSNDFKIDGKDFKKYNRHFTVLGTYEGGKHLFVIYILDSITGEEIHSMEINDERIKKIPLLSVYDNAVILAIPYDGKYDEIQLIELFFAPEIASNPNLDDMKKPSLSKLVYPIRTTLKLDWHMYGANIMRVDNVDYIVTINDENELKMTEIEKLKRGATDMTSDENTKEIDLPENMKFLAPITMDYDNKERTIFVHGIDAYYYKLK